jgi:protein TonB
MSTSPSSSDVVVLHPAAARADLGAVVPQRADTVELGAGVDLTNVIPFRRPIEGTHVAPEVVLPADLARAPAPKARDRTRRVAFIVLALALHGAVAATLLWHEPEPLASVGLEAITVEISLGATAPAGAAPTPGENETPAPVAPEPQAAETKPAEEMATAQPQTVEVAKEETAPEQKPEPAKPEEMRPAEPQPAPVVAMVEAPTETPAEAKPVETPPPQSAPKPVKDAAPAKEQRRIAAPTRERPMRQAKATPSAPANNLGVGRSGDDANYRGLVAAHLSRYKHPLPDTRGTASVTFTIGGGGTVTSVRLAHGSGVAGIDSEVQAMVRRASPFPAPPGGRPQSFTVPVSFKVN